MKWSKLAREPVLCSCSLLLQQGPKKALSEFLVWPLVNFYWLGKAKNPGQYQIDSTQPGAVVPFWGEDLSTQDHWMQLPPQVDTRTSYFHVTVFGKSFWPTIFIQATLSTPPFVLFPLLIALYFSSLFPISVLSFCESDIRKLQHHPAQLVRPCSLWPVMAHLDGWQAEVGEACLSHTVQTLVQQAVPDGRFMRVTEVYTSYSVVTGRPIIPANSSLFSCCLFL